MLKAVDDRILVRPANESTTASGLVVAGNAGPARRATVVSVSRGAYTQAGIRVALDVVEGDIVKIGEYAGVPVGEGLLSIKQEDVLAVEAA